MDNKNIPVYTYIIPYINDKNIINIIYEYSRTTKKDLYNTFDTESVDLLLEIYRTIYEDGDIGFIYQKENDMNITYIIYSYSYKERYKIFKETKKPENYTLFDKKYMYNKKRLTKNILDTFLYKSKIFYFKLLDILEDIEDQLFSKYDMYYTDISYKKLRENNYIEQKNNNIENVSTIRKLIVLLNKILQKTILQWNIEDYMFLNNIDKEKYIYGYIDYEIEINIIDKFRYDIENMLNINEFYNFFRNNV